MKLYSICRVMLIENHEWCVRRTVQLTQIVLFHFFKHREDVCSHRFGFLTHPQDVCSHIFDSFTHREDVCSHRFGFLTHREDVCSHIFGSLTHREDVHQGKQQCRVACITHITRSGQNITYIHRIYGAKTNAGAPCAASFLSFLR